MASIAHEASLLSCSDAHTWLLVQCSYVMSMRHFQTVLACFDDIARRALARSSKDGIISNNLHALKTTFELQWKAI